jgi:hypothetical protein
MRPLCVKYKICVCDSGVICGCIDCGHQIDRLEGGDFNPLVEESAASERQGEPFTALMQSLRRCGAVKPRSPQGCAEGAGLDGATPTRNDGRCREWRVIVSNTTSQAILFQGPNLHR